MFKIKPGQKRLPFGGHHYYQDMGLHRALILVNGDTAEDVAKKLRDLRINNGIAVDDPLQDVLDYYAARFPWMVMLDRNAEEKHEATDYAAWRAWIFKMWGRSNIKSITKKEAHLRWEACKDCPFNQQKWWDETDESAELTRKTLLLRRGHAVPQNIGYCSLHRWDLSVATFMETPDQVSEKEKDIAQPDCCWV